jgi:hypothetical protein
VRVNYEAFTKGLSTVILVLCVVTSLTSIFPTPALSHQAGISIQITHLDECAVDAIASATPQSEDTYLLILIQESFIMLAVSM